MSRTRMFGTLSLLFTLASAGTASALPPRCSYQCVTPGEDDELVCTCFGSAPVIFCADYFAGYCPFAPAPGSEEASASMPEESAEAALTPGEERAEEEASAGVCMASR